MALNRPYRPSLKQLHSTCEHNYAALMRLTRRLTAVGDTLVVLVGPRQRFRLRLDEQFRYTSTVSIEQLGPVPHYLRARMQVRLYHDARMAEVCASQHFSRLAPRYSYPNDKMHQPDEKMQVNLFLSDWLRLCLQQGRSNHDITSRLN